MGDSKDLGYGERLSAEEFDRRIVALYSGLPPDPGKQMQQETSRRELDLTIDHRLGTRFPQERREALWQIQQRVEKRRLRLLFGRLLSAFSYRPLYRQANGLAGYLVDEYAKVLSPEELQAYFDLAPGERPTLPFDVEQP
ncbi:MAG: hypothetical protein ACM3Y9_12340 [Ignavibacteria bacterium]